MAGETDDVGGLSHPEAMRLLAEPRVGRVAVSRHSLPAIIPVTYCLLGSDVVFAIEPGTDARDILHDNVVAFEVDDVDLAGTGWSVMVVGVVRRLERRDTDWQLVSDLNARRRPPGTTAVDLFRLATDRLSGQRLAGHVAS